MRWPKRNIRQDVSVDDPRVAEVLEEITNRLNATSSQLKDFSDDLQVNINYLKRYAANAEKKVQDNR